MKYLIVIERTATGYSAYSPDVPGCIATGESREEVEREMKGAISFHLDASNRKAGSFRNPAPPPPTSKSLSRDSALFSLFLVVYSRSASRAAWVVR